AWIGPMLSVLWIAAALIVLRLAGELVLSALNRAEVRRHAGPPPPAVAAIMDRETYAKAVAYTLEKSRFGVLTELFDTGVLLLVLFSGVLPMLFNVTSQWGGQSSTWNHALFIVLAGLLLA